MQNNHTYQIGTTDFEIAFPELAHAPELVVLTAMADAQDATSETHFQDLYRRAVLLLSAHLVASRWLNQAELQSMAAGVATGQFQAVSRGTSQSGTQAIANWRGDDLHSTRYGLQLLNLKVNKPHRFVYA
jgi:hypothetical protein